MASFERLSTKSNYALVRTGNIIILQWTGVPSEDALQPLEQAFKYLSSANKDQKIGFLTIMEEEMMSQPTPQNVRAGVGRILQMFNASIAATTIVYEGTGMKATVIRTMISTVNLISRSTFPSRVDESLTSGVNWFISTMGTNTTLRSSDMLGIIKDLRSKRSAA